MRSTPTYIHQRVRQYDMLKRITTGGLNNVDSRQMDNELFYRGLIQRRPAGGIAVTEKGKQLMFQIECEKALKEVALGSVDAMDETVANWLLSQRFIVEPTKLTVCWAITRRGRAWLETLVEPLSVPDKDHSAMA